QTPAPPYLTRDAAQTIVRQGIEHLIVDLASLDREHDEGRLTAHRIFFGLPPGVSSLQQVSRPGATVTELAHIPHPLADGPCLLELQIPAWRGDAVPSRPLLYALLEPPTGPSQVGTPELGQSQMGHPAQAERRQSRRDRRNCGAIGGKRSVAQAACADDLRTHTRSRARARRRGSSSRLPATFRDAHGLAWEGPCLSVRAFTGTDALGGTRGRSRRDG